MQFQHQVIRALRSLMTLNSVGLSQIDVLYRSVLQNNFFGQGWGPPARIRCLLDFQKIVSNREKCTRLVDPFHPISVKVVKRGRGYTIIRGEMKSPVVDHMPGFLPPECETAHFEFCVPRKWLTEDKPVCIHMSGTGDHYFWRRRLLLARPLLRKGIASLLMENPFYGDRKPQDQKRSNLNHVDNIFLMGAGLILESLAILRWLEREGYGPFCLTGISMGGHMASLAATSWPKPIAVVPCLSWSSASGVFTRGVMSKVVNWDKLKEQFETEPEFREVILSRLCNFPWVLTKEYTKAKSKEKSDEVNLSMLGWDDSFKKNQEARQEIARQKYVFRLMNKLGLVKVLNQFLASKDKNHIFATGKSSSFIHPYLFTILKNLQSQTQITHHDPNSLSPDFSIFTTKGEDNKQIDLVSCMGVFEPSFEAVEFMRRLMDHFTHLANFEKPVDSELAIVVTARSDAYVLRDGVQCIRDLWPGVTVRYVDAGHILAYVKHQSDFMRAIQDAIDKHRKKYNTDGTPKILAEA